MTTHKVTFPPDNERGDIEIRDYVLLPRGEDNSIPPLTLLMEVTMTHDDYGRTTHCTNGTLTHRVSSTGTPQSVGTLNNVDRIKIRHYRQLYVDRPDPIVFLNVDVNTSDVIKSSIIFLITTLRCFCRVFIPCALCWETNVLC